MTSSSLKEKTAKGLFWGGISNGLQQVLGLLFGIILGRILTRADYGMVGVLAIFQALASLLQESGFTSALTIKKEATPKDYNAVFWFSLMVSILIYTILFFCAPLIANFYHDPKLVPLARFCFLSFVISSLSIAPRAYLFRNVCAKQNAIVSLASIGIAGVVAVVMSIKGFAYWGIATQTLVYCLVGVVLNWYFAKIRPSFHFDFTPIRQMFGFSSKLLVTNVFTTISNNIFSVLLGRFYSPKIVGDYTQANKWNNMGHSFVTGMINGVAQPILASVQEEEHRQMQVFRKMLRFTAFICFPVMFGLSIVSKEFIVIALTDKWIESAMIMQILCIWGAFIPLNGLFANLMISRGHSSVNMYCNIALSLAQIITAILTYPYGIYTMVKMFVVINILWLAIWYLLARKEIHLRWIDFVKDISPYFLLSAALCIGANYLTMGITSLFLSLIIKIAVVALLYISILWLLGSVMLKESIKFILLKIHR